MAQLNNVEGLSPQQIQQLVNQGGKFVVYKYVISILIMTFNRGSDIFFIRPGESALLRGLPYTILSFSLGWWGIPWGIIYTFGALYTNLTGGVDVTADIMSQISANMGQAQSSPTSGSGYNVPGSGNASNNSSGSGNSGYNVPGGGSSGGNSSSSNSSSSPYNIPK